MNKKILLIIPIVVIGLFLLTGCNNSENSVNAASSSRFSINDEAISISTFVDSKTGVEYAIVRDRIHSDIEIIVLQNEDGTPKVK